jgi:hypothetical protein
MQSSSFAFSGVDIESLDVRDLLVGCLFFVVNCAHTLVNFEAFHCVQGPCQALQELVGPTAQPPGEINRKVPQLGRALTGLAPGNAIREHAERDSAPS